MPLQHYGVLIGRPIAIRLGSGRNPHYQVQLVGDTTDYRIAVNVKSNLAPSEVEYIVLDRFRHPFTARVQELPKGFTPLTPEPGSGALDYIRGNLFDRSAMRPLPFDVPGLDNDLNEKIDRVMQRALGDETALVYAFGERWGPEPQKKDKYFGFLPGNGIHDIHMNQGNVGRYIKDDGVWQDGGLLVRFPEQDEWTAVFLKFQSQSWHTDDRTGHRLTALPAGYSQFELPTGAADQPAAAPTLRELPDFEDPQGIVRIVAALVNSAASPEVETVTLLNPTPGPVDLTGWTLLDTHEARLPLSGVISSGEARQIAVSHPLALSNKGGVITLVDGSGLKVDGVSYTREQAQNPGWTILF